MRILGKLVGTVGFCGLVTLSLGAGRLAAAASSGPPDLAGTWKINPDLTSRLTADENGESAPSSTQHKPHHSTEMTPVGGNGPMGDGGVMGGKTPPPKEDSAAGEKPPNPATLPSLDRLVIDQQSGQVTVTERDGRTRAMKTDGSKVHGELTPDGPAEFRARWEKDGTLRVEVKPDKGRKHVETYVVANDRKHLYVTVSTTDVNGVTTKVLRAYDLVPPAGTPAAPGAADAGAGAASATPATAPPPPPASQHQR